VNNFYEEEELIMNPPPLPIIEKLTRHILVERPRVTKFNINWDDGFAFATDENGNPNIMPGSGENILEHGTQFKDRNDMMSSANLAQVQQTFYGAQ
jgi:hypothetical protein